MRRKDNYVMRKLKTPKKVTLPNSRTFYIKYQIVPRSQLPDNVIMKRKYKRRGKGQRGWGFLSSFNKIHW